MNRVVLRLLVLLAFIGVAIAAWLTNMTGSAEDKFAVTAGFILLFLPMAFGAWFVFLFGEWLWRYARGERPSGAIGVLLAIALGLSVLFALFLFGVA